MILRWSVRPATPTKPSTNSAKCRAMCWWLMPIFSFRVMSNSTRKSEKFMPKKSSFFTMLYRPVAYAKSKSKSMVLLQNQLRSTSFLIVFFECMKKSKQKNQPRNRFYTSTLLFSRNWSPATRLRPVR